MRCSRCDQPVVPQALGLAPDGRIVFGWCLNCLEDAGCVNIEVARPRRRPSTRLVLREASRRSWFEPSALTALRRDNSEVQLSPARQLLQGSGAIMGIWGVILLISGVVLLSRGSLPRLNPIQGSIPHLMIVGGGMVASAGAVVWLIATHFWTRSRSWLRGAQAVFFGAALAILGFGVATHDPKRDPWIVTVATIALVISALARWVEFQTPKFTATYARGGSEATKTKAR